MKPLPRAFLLLTAVAALAVVGGPWLQRQWALFRISSSGLGVVDSLSADDAHSVRAGQVADAACARRQDDVELFRQAGYSVTGTSLLLGLTPMHCAAFWGDTELIRRLAHNGGDPAAVSDELSVQPIHLAAAGGQIEAIRLLIDLGASIDATSEAGVPVTIAFTQQIHEVLPKQFHRWLRDMDDEPDFARDSALLAAFEALGASLDAVNARGESLAHLAVGIGDAELVGRLLEIGLDPDVRDSQGRTPLILASQVSTYRPLLNKPAIVDALLDGGADINARAADGVNALCHTLDEPDVALMLVERGIDPNAAPASGNSCWDALRRSMSPREIIRLADNIPGLGTPLRPDGTPGGGPLLGFVQTNDLDLVEYFLDRGLEPRDRGRNGISLLHAALMSTGGVGDHEAARRNIVERLLSAGADINARADDGRTPIMVAGRQPADVLQLLVDRGADLDAVNPQW